MHICSTRILYVQSLSADAVRPGDITGDTTAQNNKATNFYMSDNICNFSKSAFKNHVRKLNFTYTLSTIVRYKQHKIKCPGDSFDV